MKVLHYNVFKRVPAGVKNQLLDEYRARESLGPDHRWDVVVSCTEDWHAPVTLPVSDGQSNYPLWLHYRHSYHRLADIAGQYDAVLLRYRAANPWQLGILRRLDNVYTVHHALEEYERSSDGRLAGSVETVLERLLGPRCLAEVRGAIALTPEILEYESARVKGGARALVYPNGIYTPGVPVAGDQRSGCRKYLFSGSLNVKWHGLDIVVERLLEADPAAELHIVGAAGDGFARQSERIIAHGYRSRDEIADIAAYCDAGLGSFALHRKGMREACTLKVREYLALGLPVVAGYPDSGLPQDFPFYLTITGDEMWSGIAAAVDEWRQVMRPSVREWALPFVDKANLMRNLLKGLEKT